jgi:hypothetical protein
MICPLCAHRVPVEERPCPHCGVDLTEYARVHFYPEHLFNDGLAKLGREQWCEAALAFSRVCAYRPHDVEALRAWAYAAARDGRYAEALSVLVDALAESDSPDLQGQYEATLELCSLHDQGVAQAWVALAADLRSGLAGIADTLARLDGTLDVGEAAR